MNEELKPKKRTRVKPGFVRRNETCLLKTREALFLPVSPCYRDDNGNYIIKSAYVLLREDWEEYNDFLFSPSLNAIKSGRFVSQLFEDGIIYNVLEKVYIEVDKHDFLEVVKNNLQ